MDYCSSLANLNEVKDCPNYKFIKGNILSADLLRYVFETEQIDTIIHAAAQVRALCARPLSGGATSAKRSDCNTSSTSARFASDNARAGVGLGDVGFGDAGRQLR